jgi:hypothetical protein
MTVTEDIQARTKISDRSGTGDPKKIRVRRST